MNAQVGLSRPGDYGADVSHLNLQRRSAFRMAAVAREWADRRKSAFGAVPSGHPTTDGVKPRPVGPVSAAPFGSASILTISYIYILMMSAKA